jgi:hypothetical protein
LGTILSSKAFPLSKAGVHALKFPDDIPEKTGT